MTTSVVKLSSENPDFMPKNNFETRFCNGQGDNLKY